MKNRPDTSKEIAVYGCGLLVAIALILFVLQIIANVLNLM